MSRHLLTEADLGTCDVIAPGGVDDVARHVHRPDLLHHAQGEQHGVLLVPDLHLGHGRWEASVSSCVRE